MKLPQHKGLVKILLQLWMIERYGIDVKECPCCKQKTLQLLKIFDPDGRKQMMADKKMQICVAYHLSSTGNVDGRKGSTMSIQEKNNDKNRE